MRPVGDYVTAFVKAVRSDAILYGLVALYCGIGLMIVGTENGSLAALLEIYAGKWWITFGLIPPFFIFCAGLLHIVHRLDKRRSLAFRHMFAPARLARFLAGTVLMLTALMLFNTVFSAIKTMLPLGTGFPYDVLQADIDKAIHFGTDPYRLLYAFAGHPLVLQVIEFNYNVVWFALCYFTLFWVVTSPRANAFRIRFVLTWMLSWIVLGNIVAFWCLSAGPAFYGQITGDEARFADQLNFLAVTADSAHSAHNYQAYLWYLYDKGLSGFGSGISAFPSMHVAMTVLLALFVGEHSRRLGVIAWAYAGFVIISSVYLGWHYAIDGYAAAILVTAIYWALRKAMPQLARLRWRRRAANGEAPVNIPGIA